MLPSNKCFGEVSGGYVVPASGELKSIAYTAVTYFAYGILSLWD